jgi:hypothetical protein
MKEAQQCVRELLEHTNSLYNAKVCARELLEHTKSRRLRTVSELFF